MGEAARGEGPDESPDPSDGPDHLVDARRDVLVDGGGVVYLPDILLPGVQSLAKPAALRDSSELLNLLCETEDHLLLLPGVL